MQRWLSHPLTTTIIRPLRRVLGFGFLGIGLLGAIFPVIPGWPAFLVAIVLLGRRDRTIRRGHLLLRRTIRWLRTTRITPIRRVGQRISTKYVQLRRSMTPHLISLERRVDAVL